MNGIDTSQLVVVERNFEAAFKELVDRHIGLVYSTALRRVAGDTHLAQDVAQIVFRDLALKGAFPTRKSSVAGWLYRHTCFTASKIARGESRRRAREKESAMMDLENRDNEPSWERIAPLLDCLMLRLNSRERDAVVLRYISGRSLGEVAGELKTSEEAARKLVSRGLTKLRALLIKRGVTGSAPGLVAALAAGAVVRVPEGLAAAVSTFVLADAAFHAVSTTAAVVAIMTKLKIAAACAVVAGLVSSTFWQQSKIDRLRGLNDALRVEADAARKLAAIRAGALTPESSADAERRRKDFHELMQLRGEVAVLHARIGEMSAKGAAADDAAKASATGTTAAAQSFRAAGNVRVPDGQTLVTGGWLTASGARNFIFAKLTINGEQGRSPTVIIRTALVEMTADAVNQAGFNQLLTDGTESQQAALYTKDQWDAQMETLTNLDGVRFLARPSVLTRGDGGPATIQMAGNGTNYVLQLSPQITSEGDAVDLSYDAGLDLPNAPPPVQP